MPHAKLRVTIPERVWIGDLSRRHPDAVFRVLAAFPADESGVGLVEIDAAGVDDILRAVHDYDAVVSVDVLRRVEGQALVQFETNTPLLLLPARDSGVPLEMPVEINDGVALWELTASRDRLSELGQQLDQFDIPYRVVAVREDHEDEQLLTVSQRRVLSAAIEEGYYDTPRETSLTALAEELDIAKSTASETLHRAEEKIIKEFAESLDHPEPTLP